MNAPLSAAARSGCLASRIAQAGGEGRWLWDGAHDVALSSAISETRLGGRRDDLAGKSILIRTKSQLSAALILIELDGAAKRLIIAPPDLDEAHLPSVIEDGAVDAIVGDIAPPTNIGVEFIPLTTPSPRMRSSFAPRRSEWVMFTSGTTGRPKMVAHSLMGLTGAIKTMDQDPPVWGTFYDIRRYGGLQMILRALLGGGSMILSNPDESIAEFLGRLGARGVTHLSGTPSHWRKALMSPALHQVSPRYVRLSGEIADQAVLDNLQAAFPGVPVGHAYASTEAGVGFEVNDGREGFPAAYLDREGEVQMRVVDGALQLRSIRTASRYLGADAQDLADADGFVDTGDLVERRGERFYFMGRRSGVINVGGLKIHPEEVEAVINRHPGVRMSLVRGRKNPITGAIVVADVVAEGFDDSLKDELFEQCRAALPPFKVPTAIRFVDSLAVTPGGKLERRVA
jgi:acyl-coenzyme A synthetase/AMP-(fatty) acid ligase